MNKATFTAALKRAQEVQGTYKIEQSRCDALYDELKGEDEQAVLDALKRLGKTDKTISYFNIKAFMSEGSGRFAKPAPPMEPVSAEDEEEIREMLVNLYKKFRR